MLIIIACLLVAIVVAIVSLFAPAANTESFVPEAVKIANSADTAIMHLRQVLL
jgi:hypothetical protein